MLTQRAAIALPLTLPLTYPMLFIGRVRDFDTTGPTLGSVVLVEGFIYFP